MQVPQIDSDTPISEGRRNKFHETLIAGLKDAAGTETTVVTGEEIRFALGEKPNLLECFGGPCLRQVIELVKADRLLVPRITIKAAAGGNSYKIALSVYDQSGAATPIIGSESCGDDGEGCNLARAFDALKRSTASIAGQVGGSARSEPAAAAASAATPQAATLKEPLKEPAVEPSPKPLQGTKAYRYGWITAAALTGAFVVASIPFFAFAAKEGQTTCPPSVPRDQCPSVYTGNLGPGLGLLLGGGLASAGAFGILFYLDRREARRIATK